MSRELHCYLQKNALTVLNSTDRLPFSLVPRTSSRHELNQALVNEVIYRNTEFIKENVNV